jgi:hypothetical protein
MSHDPNFGFVVAAYALAFVVIGGMIAAILIDSLRLKRALSLFALPGQSQHAEAQPSSQGAAPQGQDPEGFD